MKNNSFGTNLLMLLVTLGVLTYFGIETLRYFDDPLMTSLAYDYQVEEGVDVTGYVVRQEVVLTDSVNGSLRLQRSEGERVSTGGLVATVYADQSSLDRQTEIDALNLRLEQLEYAQSAALGAEATVKLDAQILQSIRNLRGAVTADRLDRAEEYGQTLRGLVLRRDYTYSGTDDLAAQIAALQSQITILQTQTASSVRRITAPQSGLYSAVVDGYESVLTPDTIEELTPSQLESVQPTGTVSPVGKLILGDYWYYAAVLDEETAQKLEKQSSLTLRFAKTMERDLQVTVDSIGPAENGQVVVTFRGRTYLPQLTLLRRQSAQIIEKTVEGIRVPKEALRAQQVNIDEEGNRVVTEQTGVYCMVGAAARFKPVKIVYSGEDFVLVRSVFEDAAEGVTDAQEKLRIRPGDEIIIAAEELYDGKVLNQ